MNQLQETKISVIGLGKLGSCLAAALAYKGFDVLGLDINERTVALINGGQAPVFEPRLQEIIDRARGRLVATTDFKKVIDHASLCFIIVPTPSEPDGSFSPAILKTVLKQLAEHIKDKSDNFTIVISSTVTPTIIEKALVPFVEQHANKKINAGWDICYNPEFIALGNVVSGILEPDIVLVGESRPAAGDRLEQIYRQLCSNQLPIARMSLVSAEIAKIALNAFVTMKISFANTLGNICEQVPGADVDTITKALGADKRISPHFLKAGLSFGGPCFPRDNRAFNAFAKEAGVDAPLARATDQINNLQIEKLFEKISRVLEESRYDSIAILGLAYKPKTDIIEESAIVKIIGRILEKHKGIKVTVYDPLALINTQRLYGDKILYTETVSECLNQSPFWVITSPEEEFKIINDQHLKHQPTTIIDCWRVLDPSVFKGQVRYLPLGSDYNGNN